MWTAVAILVYIGLSFDPSIRSSVIRTRATEEATAIWHDYNVDLDWRGDDDAEMCVTASVDRTRRRAEPDKAMILGSTVVPDRPNGPVAPIRIGFDAIDDLAEPPATSNPILHDYSVGTAIGRVLAHEVGHILLGAPAYHDGDGLMRRNFLSNDFLPWDRSRYRLSPGSVARLYDRLSRRSIVHPAPGCPAH